MAQEIPLIDLVMCAVISVAKAEGAYSGYKGSSITLVEDIQRRFGLAVDEPQLIRAAKRLESVDVTIVSRESESDLWISVDHRHFRQIYNSRKNANAKRDVTYLFSSHHALKTYGEFGEDWLENAIGMHKEMLASDQSAPADTELGEIPASDRIVRIDDNLELAKEIRGAASELVQQIRVGNDLGELTREQADAAANEVHQIGLLFEAETVRPSTVMALAKQTLHWISDKAGGAMVGAAAIALLALIARFFGFEI